MLDIHSRCIKIASKLHQNIHRTYLPARICPRIIHRLVYLFRCAPRRPLNRLTQLFLWLLHCPAHEPSPVQYRSSIHPGRSGKLTVVRDPCQHLSSPPMSLDLRTCLPSPLLPSFLFSLNIFNSFVLILFIQHFRPSILDQV